MDIINILSFPFFQRALLGGVVISLLASLMGVFVLLKRSAFFGDSIAHASLTGVALGLLLGFSPVGSALVFAVLLALFLPYLEKKSGLSLDSLLGFMLPFSLGLGVILLQLLPGYQPDLMSYLFGNILSISWNQLIVIVGLAVCLLLFIMNFRRQLLFSILDPDSARINNIPVEQMNMIMSICLGITVVLCLSLVGVILVNALLIIPAMTAKLYSHSLRHLFILTPLIALVIVLMGLLFSVLLNLPSGPAIAVFSGALFLLGVFTQRLTMKP